jgi:ABC-type branched-subunit amino acid transport system ATPase component
VSRGGPARLVLWIGLLGALFLLLTTAYRNGARLLMKAIEQEAHELRLEVSARFLDGRTVLLVAHRLTQAAGADQVIVLGHGEVVESGTHADLVAAGGRYAEFWKAWQTR